MEDKPKSIWKRPLPLPQLFLAWLGLLAATMILFVIATLVLEEPLTNANEVVRFFIFGVASASLLLGIWIGLRRLFCWRSFKRFLFAGACLATLIAMFYTAEDWRGKHDWAKFKREWQVKGERFDFKDFLPKPVPEDRNFAMSPVWIAEVKHTFLDQPPKAESWYGDRIFSASVSNLLPQVPVSVSGLVGENYRWNNHAPQLPEMRADWTLGRTVDLKAWQTYYRDLERTNPAAQIPIAPQPQSPAADVLLALSKFDPVIEQLRADSALPDSRFPVVYDGEPAAILLPHLAPLKRYSQVLQLRALGELQNHESQQALDDVRLSLRLVDSVRTERLLISHLLRLGILQIAIQPIYEGLVQHQWSDAQLADLESQLMGLNFLADFEFSLRGIPAFDIASIEFLRRPSGFSQIFPHPRLYFLAPLYYRIQDLSVLGPENGPGMQTFPMLALSFGPSGWLDQNERHICQFYMEWYLPLVDQNAESISPARVRAADDALKTVVEHQTPENVLAAIFVPYLGGVSMKFAFAQCSVNFARVAVALERYRLAHGAYPESLDALAPRFLATIPRDIINGQPLHYRRTNDGLFVLYSVGWNERDDGGVVVLTKGESPAMDKLQGDWVWRYPADKN